MRIAILGSPFDPPHLGHLLVAQQTIDFGPGIDQVWLMPDFTHPWREQTASSKQRLEMAKFLANQSIRVSDLAIKRGKTSFAIDTVRELKKKFSHQFFWLIGSDALESFDQWKKPDELVKEIPFLVFSRLDYPVKKLPSGFTLIDSPLLICTDISSTKIRERIKKGLSIAGMAPEPARRYIKKHRLYR